MTGGPWLAAGAALAVLLGLWLMRAGRGMRRRRGLSDGRTVSLDDVTLTSARLGLTGRPDRLIKGGGHRGSGTVLVEEWKSSRALRPGHRAQMGVYFLLAEDQLGICPTHGFIVTGDGARHRIENSDALRAWVLELAGEIRSGRANARQSIRVNPKPGQCRPCGVRGHCGQARF